MNASTSHEPWHILIGDHEESIHHLIRLALKGLHFKGRHLKFFSAYTQAETLEMLRSEESMALAMLNASLAPLPVEEIQQNLPLMWHTDHHALLTQQQRQSLPEDMLEKAQLTVERLHTSIREGLTRCTGP